MLFRHCTRNEEPELNEVNPEIIDLLLSWIGYAELRCAYNDEIALGILLAHYKLRPSPFGESSPFLTSPERA
jgi:hypothetical protein